MLTLPDDGLQCLGSGRRGDLVAAPSPQHSIETLSGSESKSEKSAMRRRHRSEPAGNCHRLPRRSLGEGGKIRLAVNGRPRKLSGLNPVRDTPEFAKFLNEVARRRAIMKRRVEAMRDQLNLAAE